MNASTDHSMDSVVDLSLSSEDSDLSVPHMQDYVECSLMLQYNKL